LICFCRQQYTSAPPHARTRTHIHTHARDTPLKLDTNLPHTHHITLTAPSLLHSGGGLSLPRPPLCSASDHPDSTCVCVCVCVWGGGGRCELWRVGESGDFTVHLPRTANSPALRKATSCGGTQGWRQVGEGKRERPKRTTHSTPPSSPSPSQKPSLDIIAAFSEALDLPDVSAIPPPLPPTVSPCSMVCVQKRVQEGEREGGERLSQRRCELGFALHHNTG
jgi:hypothetical protein